MSETADPLLALERLAGEFENPLGSIGEEATVRAYAPSVRRAVYLATHRIRQLEDDNDHLRGQLGRFRRSKDPAQRARGDSCPECHFPFKEHTEKHMLSFCWPAALDRAKGENFQLRTRCSWLFGALEAEVNSRGHILGCGAGIPCNARCARSRAALEGKAAP